MKRAAIVGIADGQAFLEARDVQQVRIVNLEEFPDRRAMAVTVAWEVALEPDDHPALGVLEVLVRPDGRHTPLGFTAGATAVAMGIQALELEPPGRYTVELRAMTQPPPTPGPRTPDAAAAAAAAWNEASASERRVLAVLPLEVIEG